MADRQRELFEDLPELEPPPDLAGGYVLPSAPAPRGESPPGNCRCYKGRHLQRHGDSGPRGGHVRRGCWGRPGARNLAYPGAVPGDGWAQLLPGRLLSLPCRGRWPLRTPRGPRPASGSGVPGESWRDAEMPAPTTACHASIARRAPPRRNFRLPDLSRNRMTRRAANRRPSRRPA